MNKYFIITVDTEGDNLWNWKKGDEITTRNTEYLPRFQELCNSYGFFPVWLCNYEMISSSKFVKIFSKAYSEKKCEIGVHIHAWNNPPLYDLPSDANSAQPYLIEYPYEIIDSKIEYITKTFINNFGFQPVSHRAGRWAIDAGYMKLLNKHGYMLDCSIVPGMDMKKNVGQTPGFNGPDYSCCDNCVRYIEGILEVPLATVRTAHFFSPQTRTAKGYLRSVYHIFMPQILHLRPNGRNLEEMLHMVKLCRDSDRSYIMFMIHSSELMPGGSPTFTTESDVEKLYADLDILFGAISESYAGITLKDYYSIYTDRHKNGQS